MTSLQSAKLLTFHGALELDGPWQCSKEEKLRHKHHLETLTTVDVDDEFKIGTLRLAVDAMYSEQNATTQKCLRDRVPSYTTAIPGPFVDHSAEGHSLISYQIFEAACTAPSAS